MSRHPVRPVGLVRLIAVVMLTLVALAGAAALAPVAVAGNEPPPVTDNEFIPENRDLSECVSSIPLPDCGSDARSDWRQYAVLGALLAGLAFIAWRVVAGARRTRDREPETADRS